MRIAYDSDIFSMQAYGGVSRYFVRLARELIAGGEEVGVFAPIYQNQYLRTLPNFATHGVGVDRYIPRTSRIMIHLNKSISRRSINRWKPDVVHETYYGRTSSANPQYPVVITVYDMIHELFPHEFSGADTTIETKRLALNRADHVICISHNTRKDLLEIYGLDPVNVSVVHLGFEKFPREPSSTWRSRSSDKPYLLYVGNRGGYKNFNGFIRAVASRPELMRDVDIVTFGGGAFKSDETRLIRGLGFSEGQIRQVNGDDQLLGSLYTHAVALVYPSLYEGFGLPPLEAMASQCPVVSSNASSLPEVVGDAAECFDPVSTDEMADAIERVLYSSERRNRLIELGNLRLEIFNWHKCGTETLNIYRKFDSAP